MKKLLKLILVIVVIGLLVLQFFQPKKNLETASSVNDLLTVQHVPDDIAGILKNSCYDCHSNNTRYVWYHRISPVSWMIDDHIREGKDELNFSEWNEMDIYDQVTNLEDIAHEVRGKKMPLKPYLLMHPSAKLSDEQIVRLEQWTTELGESLLSKALE